MFFCEFRRKIRKLVFPSLLFNTVLDRCLPEQNLNLYTSVYLCIKQGQ